MKGSLFPRVSLHWNLIKGLEIFFFLIVSKSENVKGIPRCLAPGTGMGWGLTWHLLVPIEPFLCVWL